MKMLSKQKSFLSACEMTDLLRDMRLKAMSREVALQQQKRKESLVKDLHPIW